MKVKTLLQCLERVPDNTIIMDIYGDNIGLKAGQNRTGEDKNDIFLVTRPYKTGFLTAADMKSELSLLNPENQIAFPSGKRMHMSWLKKLREDMYVLELCGIQDIPRSGFISLENYLRDFFMNERRLGTEKRAAYEKLGETGFLLKDLQESSFYEEALEMEEKYHWQDLPGAEKEELEKKPENSTNIDLEYSGEEQDR